MIETESILKGLINGDFLETDGETYWWVNDGDYKEITRKVFYYFIKNKYVHAKKIDDETTCFYLIKDNNELVKSDNKMNEHKINQIKDFINRK